MEFMKRCERILEINNANSKEQSSDEVVLRSICEVVANIEDWDCGQSPVETRLKHIISHFFSFFVCSKTGLLDIHPCFHFHPG